MSVLIDVYMVNDVNTLENDVNTQQSQCSLQITHTLFELLFAFALALHEVTSRGAWLSGVYRTRRDGSSFTLTIRQRCK